MAFTTSFKNTAGWLLDAYYTSNSTGLVWKNSSTAMAVDNDATATLPQQAVPLAESGTRPGKFILTHPAALPADTYSVSVRHRLGGSPAAGDVELFFDAEFLWDGQEQAAGKNYQIIQS